MSSKVSARNLRNLRETVSEAKYIDEQQQYLYSLQFLFPATSIAAWLKIDSWLQIFKLFRIFFKIFSTFPSRPLFLCQVFIDQVVVEF